MTITMIEQRPLCECHGQPMLHNGTSPWYCRVKKSVLNARRYVDPIRRANQQVYFHRYRAKKIGAENTLTIAEWNAILDEHDWKCACGCGQDYSDMDHVEGIAEGHTASNVQPLARSCHKTKTASEKS